MTRARIPYTRPCARAKAAATVPLIAESAAEQAAPITTQDFGHVTGWSHDGVISTQSELFVDP